MKQEIIGSDNLTYDVSWYLSYANKEKYLNYQIRSGDIYARNSIQIADQGQKAIEDLEIALKVNAPGTIKEINKYGRKF